MYHKVIDMDDGLVFAYDGDLEDGERVADEVAEVLTAMGVTVERVDSDKESVLVDEQLKNGDALLRKLLEWARD